MSIITVCRGCPNRATRCHTVCQKYLKEKMKHELQIAKNKKNGCERHFIQRSIERAEQRAKNGFGRRVGQR